MTVPFIKDLEADVDNIAATSDEYTIIGRAPWAGTVTAVTYYPRDSVTGLTLATAARTMTVYNRGNSTGTGSTAVATRTVSSGTDLANNVAFDLTLSTTSASLVVASGDLLELESLHITTGVLDPGGRIIVRLSRT